MEFLGTEQAVQKHKHFSCLRLSESVVGRKVGYEYKSLMFPRQDCPSILDSGVPTPNVRQEQEVSGRGCIFEGQSNAGRASLVGKSLSKQVELAACPEG